jgi:hypothetical protein
MFKSTLPLQTAHNSGSGDLLKFHGKSHSGSSETEALSAICADAPGALRLESQQPHSQNPNIDAVDE